MVNRVAYGRWLCQELESLPLAGWRRLEAHPRYWAMMEEYRRYSCLTDLWKHLQFCVYHGQMKHYDPQVHGPNGLAGWLQNWTKTEHGITRNVSKKLAAITRDGIKTQMGAAFWSWKFAQDTNRCLRVGAQNDPRSAEIGGTIFDLLRSPKYRRTYPWVKFAKKESGQFELYSKRGFMLEREDVGQRTPSMLASGVETSITGNHFHGGWYDDFETEDAEDSPALLEAVIKKIEDDQPLYVGGAIQLINGTPHASNGLVWGIADGAERFRDWHVDCFILPAEIEVFERPFVLTQDLRLDGDRLTLRARGAGFPTITESLKLCQVRVTFFNPALGQVVDEIREVVDNGPDHVVVNRPFPLLYGQPEAFVVGNMKPSIPCRHTLDEEDILPPIELESRVIPRNSLVKQRRAMGPSKYSKQYLIKPVDVGSLILNPSKLRRVKLADLPQEGRRDYFRAGDFATASKTNASTALVTGFWHPSGLYLLRSFYKEQATLLEKALELLVGQVWVSRQEWGDPQRRQRGHLKYTVLEEAMVEKNARELLDEYHKNPYEHFKLLGGKYLAAAEEWFKDLGKVDLPLRMVTRTTDKCARIASLEPLLENGQLFVVDDVFQHYDQLVEDMGFFQMQSTKKLDLLETIQQLNEEKPVYPAETQAKRENDFQRAMREAQFAAVLQGVGARAPYMTLGRQLAVTASPPPGANLNPDGIPAFGWFNN